LFVSAMAASASFSVQAADTASSVLNEVVVTGSRLPSPNLEGITPVTTVTNEEIKAAGVTRIEDLLNNLPQVVADFGGNLSNGATGAATVNLRGLGAQRTLVLVNSRRLMPGDPTQNGNATPDLNQIPAALIDRIDVLTGGASAVYGADAVAGVVNFIMNDHFEGVKIDANYSFNQHSQHNDEIQGLLAARNFAQPASNVRDGYAKDVTVIVGGNFADDRGNVTAYVGYRNLSALTQAQRDFSACSLGSGAKFTCAGSSTSALGRFFGNDGEDGVFGNGGDYTIGPNRTFIASTSANRFNFAPFNYYQRADERYTAGLFGHLDMNDHARVYTEFMFMDDRTIGQVAPSGAFLGSGNAVDPATGGVDGNWTVNCNNPLLSAQQRSIICVPAGIDADGNPFPSTIDAAGNTQVSFGRRNVEGGPRFDDLGHTAYRAVLGLKGEFAKGWTYDVYGLFGTTRLSENFNNDVSVFKLSNALQVVTDPATGNIVCKANANGANAAPGCVPYDIWSLGGVTPAAVAYIAEPGLTQGATTERVVSGSVTGDLGQHGVKTPWAADGLVINVGSEYRQEKSELIVDEAFRTGDLAGQGAPTLPLSAQFHLWEGFTEARMPIIQDARFAKTLSVEAGYRYSDYSLGFNTNTYKFGVDWAPVSDVRLRSSYQRAVRAPNIQELYLPAKVQLDGSTDPCAGPTPTPTAAQCAFSGVTAAQYGHIVENGAGQYNGLTGGNANLVPEISDTFAFGLAFTPGFLPGFTATIDYFDIKVKKVIGPYGADFIVNTCVNTGNPLYCGFVHRSPSNGSLWIGPSGYIEDKNFNLGSLATKGVDLTLDYHLDAGGLGRMDFSLFGTYVKDFITEPAPGELKYDCAGLYGATCGVPTPKWRHKFRTTWTTPLEGLSASLQWRHISAVRLDTTSSNPQLKGTVLLTDRELGSREYIDLSGAYMFAKNYTFRLGINNILDKDPPLLGSTNLPGVFGSGNTFPQVYDTLGRFIFMNLTMNF